MLARASSFCFVVVVVGAMVGSAPAGAQTTSTRRPTPVTSPLSTARPAGTVVAASSTIRPTSTVASTPTTVKLLTTETPTTIQRPTTMPTTTVKLSTAAKPGLRITATRTFAGGLLSFEPVEATAKVIRSKASAVRTAKRELPTGTLAPTPEVFFARYALETNERMTGGTGQLKRDLRTVWVVRFAGVEGRRQSSVVIRQNLPTLVPVTTIPRIVISDIVVVIDDVTGDVLLRSEFAPETGTPR